MATFPLEEDRQVTLSATGSGSAQIGPTRSRQRWKVTSVTVSTSTATNMPEARLYSPSGTLLGGTYTGSQDTTDVDITLHFGARIRVDWTGGDPGARATVSVAGTIYVE